MKTQGCEREKRERQKERKTEIQRKRQDDKEGEIQRKRQEAREGEIMKQGKRDRLRIKTQGCQREKGRETERNADVEIKNRNQKRERDNFLE